MSDVLVPVFQHRYVGADKVGPPYCAYMPLWKALTTVHKNFEHLAQYSVPDACRRLRGDLDIGNIPIVMRLLVVDVDAPRKNKTPEWKAVEKPKIERVIGDNGVVAYPTLNGYRFVGLLPEPFIIMTPDDSIRWRTNYELFLADLADLYGIQGDAGTKKWGQPFQLPSVMRPFNKDENYFVAKNGGRVFRTQMAFMGDPRDVGCWQIVQNPAKVLLPESSNVVPVGSGAGGGFAAGPVTNCLLYKLFASRGWIAPNQRVAADRCIVLCPWRGHHSFNSDGKSNTVLYGARPGGVWGKFYCSHNGCHGYTDKHVRDLFKQWEIDEVKGISSPAA